MTCEYIELAWETVDRERNFRSEWIIESQQNQVIYLHKSLTSAIQTWSDKWKYEREREREGGCWPEWGRERRWRRRRPTWRRLWRRWVGCEAWQVNRPFVQSSNLKSENSTMKANPRKHSSASSINLILKGPTISFSHEMSENFQFKNLITFFYQKKKKKNLIIFSS